MEIPVTEIGPVRIGQAENPKAATGCTVLIAEQGMAAGLDVRGGGPASRESQLLNPLMAAQQIHAVVLSGGSAYGLGAADGVMRYLEEKGYGYDTGFARVPLVAQADIYDLSVGSAGVRPDAEMGYEAAKNAFEHPNYRDGNHGAGCGDSVGKIAGMATAMKSGIGSYAVQTGELKIGAIAVVNALGDVYDWKTGRQIAGLMTEDRKGLRSTSEYMKQHTAVTENRFTGNTTLAVHTSADGDSIYALSVGEMEADPDVTGLLAAEVVSEAILRAVEKAEGAYGLPSFCDARRRGRGRSDG